MSEVQEQSIGDTEGSKPRADWLGGAGRFLLSVAVRAAQSYAADQVEQWIVRQRANMAAKLAPNPLTGVTEPPGDRRGGSEPLARALNNVAIESDIRRFQR